MGEERLIEITSEICKMEGPLWTMGYITSLNESEVYLLFKYVDSSKYRALNVYDAIFMFAHDYLKSKGILTNVVEIDYNLSYNKEVRSFDDVLFCAQVLNGNQTVNQGKSSRR